MKIVGIIAEYNPFHNGHIYHIKESTEKNDADLVIAIMSGSFTQQGNVAVLDKFTRSKIASLYGADIVLELPFIFATSSAEFFAKASVHILDSLNINILSFGSEEENIDSLLSYSKKIEENKEKIDIAIKKYLKQGFSYTKSYISSVEECLKLENTDFFKSNNILALEYLKTLSVLGSNITPVCVKRVYNNYNEKKLSNYAFSSATSIREYLETGDDISNLENYLPKEICDALKNKKIVMNETLYNYFRYKVITEKSKLTSIHEITEGFENRIYNNAILYTSYTDFLQNTVTRRFTLPKIKRIILKVLFGIEKDFFNKIDYKKDLYARVLFINDKGKQHIGSIVKNSSIPVITKLNDKIITNLSPMQQYILNKDIESANFWALLNQEELNKDYTNKL